MYGWIWRRLPFGLPGRIAGSVVLVTAAVALLWYVVFPWAEPRLPFLGTDGQVTQDSGVPAEVPAVGEVSGSPGPEDEHAIPYSTEENQPPPSPER